MHAAGAVSPQEWGVRFKHVGICIGSQIVPVSSEHTYAPLLQQIHLSTVASLQCLEAVRAAG